MFNKHLNSRYGGVEKHCHNIDGILIAIENVPFWIGFQPTAMRQYIRYYMELCKNLHLKSNI